MVNPLIELWKNAHGLPPFDQIKPEHFMPAFEEGFARHNAEVERIAICAEAPDFANTIEALELSGELLNRVVPVFYVLASGHSNAELRTIEKTLAPRLSGHYSSINARPDLYARIKQVFDARPQLTTEQQQLLNEVLSTMTRAGAALDANESKQVQAIDQRLSELQTAYKQNVLNDSDDFELVIEDEARLEGLPATVIEMGRQQGIERNKPGTWIFTISRSSFTPFMQYAAHRELRESLWRAYTRCGDNNNEFDNKSIATELAQLRAKRARLLGFSNHSDFILSNQMAGSSDSVRQLLDKVWQPAAERVEEELADLQNRVQEEGGNFEVEPWDWWFYSEKVRQDKYALSSEALKPYFELNRVRQGAFDVATRLYGITFTPMPDFQSYHQDVSGYEVREANGEIIGVFMTDYFMRPGKRSGAWMNALRKQKKFGGVEYPIICNTCNFPKATPCLLTMDEVRTLFHEFGHGLHGLLSNVNYPTLSCTAVKRDFVELPSQIMEHWAVEPDVMRSYARHHQTGEVIPDELINKIGNSQTFNQGFATSEYLAASYLDLAWHETNPDDQIDANEFEQGVMEKIGLSGKIAPRYRSTYFQHIFSGGYSSGYYAYLWAEVLDTDAYEEFKNNGIFDPGTAESFRKNILEKGGSEDPMDLYRKFKKKAPDVAPLMKARGLA